MSLRGLRGGVGWDHDPREACGRRPQPMDQNSLDHTHATECAGTGGSNGGGGGSACMGRSGGH